MSRTFTKLFSSITESTVWCEPDRTRIVWITMLAMADRHGRVWASLPGLANRARVPLEDAKLAVDRFLAPDEYSRTPSNDGRRIIGIDGGWSLLNYGKYREIRDEETIKESKRKYINTRRAAERAVAATPAENPQHVDQPVEKVDRCRANAEAEAEADKRKTTTPAQAPLLVRMLPDWLPLEQWQGYLAMRKKIRKPPTERAIDLVIAQLKSLREAGQDVGNCLDQSTKNNWTDVYELKAGTRKMPQVHIGISNQDFTKGLKGEENGSYGL